MPLTLGVHLYLCSARMTNIMCVMSKTLEPATFDEKVPASIYPGTRWEAVWNIGPVCAAARYGNN